MKITVFAPVTQRGWIIKKWLDSIVAQDIDADIDVVVLYGDPEGETPDNTRDVLDQERRIPVYTFQDIDERHVADRKWNQERYATMARLRNQLLDEISLPTPVNGKVTRPDYALSCDTDMLMPPNCLSVLVDQMQQYDGVAPLTYMTPSGTNYPNVLDLPGKKRPVIKQDTFQVDACFGVVLMNRPLYMNARYSVHRAGEDLGWAQDVRRLGLKLGLCPLVKVKHVMTREMLDHEDWRVGL